MTFIELFEILWPAFVTIAGAIIGGAWWAIKNHFTQKGRIDILEKELQATSKIVDHITESGMDIKKEQELLKVKFERMDTNIDYLVKGFDELKRTLEKK